MVLRPPGLTLPDQLFPNTSLFRSGQAATNVLRGLLFQITVQWLRVAIEQASVVCCVKWLDFETLAAHSGARSLLRRAKARFNAGAGLGGARSALVKDS